MVHFVGAGSGAPDLITLRGARLLGEADVVIYAGSLVNPELLTLTKPGCEVHDSAKLTLEEVIALIERAEREGKTTVRLHTGDPSIYGAVREQFDALTERGIDFDVCPGVSSFCGAAAALRAEYTLPNVSQTVIITRMAGRTPVPEREGIAALAAHGATMVVFLSAGMLDGLGLSSLKGALMSRGTREIARLIKALGGNELSAYGLCHLGDYEATVFSPYSHNRRYGEAFVTGEPFGELAEGAYTVKALVRLGEEHGVSLPICQAVDRVLYQGEDPRRTLDGLFSRSLKQEF